jgi:hypothetical protein
MLRSPALVFHDDGDAITQIPGAIGKGGGSGSLDRIVLPIFRLTDLHDVGGEKNEPRRIVIWQ